MKARVFGTYDSTEAIRGAALALVAQRRVSVTDGVAESLRIVQPGGYVGPWLPSETPYMCEPTNMLGSRTHEAVCFVGPSRCGKTMALVDGWLAYAATCDPGDMLIVQMTQEKAREFSKIRVDRALRNSPALHALMPTSGHDDNTHDKMFKHGMWIRIGWPSITQLSGSDYRYVALTDYDRMPDDISGEGAPYNLAQKRVQTYMSRGMCLVESSPGRPVLDPGWHAVTPHEAPPTDGILAIYNRSDRRRWYWRCPTCRGYFEVSPGLGLFTTLPVEHELLEIIRTEDLAAIAKLHAVIACPHCHSSIEETLKPTLNAEGIWLADGETIDAEGRRGGRSTRSSIAGFWLGGIPAVYQGWRSILLHHLQALRDYVLTGSEFALQATTTTDQGLPYRSRNLGTATEAVSGRRSEPLARYMVPSAARYLTAAVDVQGGANARFIVQIQAWGRDLEYWIIDRYSLRLSERSAASSDLAPIDPASYPEDWDLLASKVLSATYRTAIQGVELRIRMMAVDSGGEEGVTSNAYAFWRRMTAIGLGTRVMLVKGASVRSAPLLRETKVGGGHKVTKVPLWLLNVDELKDGVHNSLQRRTPGPGYAHFPEWLPPSFYDELGAEVRQPNGTWKKVRRANEALDLSVYNRAAALQLGAERIHWDKPPSWALPLNSGNSELVSATGRRDRQEGLAAKIRQVRKKTHQSVGLGRKGWNL